MVFDYTDLVKIIYSGVIIEGIDVSFQDVKRMVFNSSIHCGMKEAWNWMLSQDCSRITMRFLDKMNKAYKGYGVTCTRPNLWEELDILNNIPNPVDKACRFFCYLILAELFVSRNLEMALLISNIILVEAGAGLLLVKREDSLWFGSFVYDYCTGRNTYLRDYLSECCIVKTH